MLNKINFLTKSMLGIAVLAVSITGAHADQEMENLSAQGVADYQVQGSLFEQITSLEQEKVLMGLEKDRAQIQLEMDRLSAEKMRLEMEMENLSGRAEQQKKELDAQQAKLDAEAKRLAHEQEALKSGSGDYVPVAVAEPEPEVDITKNYRLVNVVGLGNQLQATIEDLSSGQKKRVSVGKELDGFTVKSISLYDGIVFDKDGAIQTLNVGVNK